MKDIVVVVGSIFLIAIGMGLLIVSSVDREYVIDNAKIIEVQDNIIKVEAGELNGDPIIYEIEKPFYKRCKSGDYISIINKDGIINYTVNRGFLDGLGIGLLIMSILSTFIFTTYNFIDAIISTKNTNNKK